MTSSLEKLFCKVYTNIILKNQEVVADETPAIQVVLAADYRRAKLLKEKEQLETDMGKKGKNVDMDRLQDVYEELKAIDAEKAEPKARRYFSLIYSSLNFY